MPTQSPKVYVLEGPDGVGKSTLAQGLCRALQQRGEDSILASSPGQRSGSIGSLVYKLHHAPTTLGIEKASTFPMQLLHLAAHADTVERDILPALAAGKSVVLDRCWWSSIVYARAGGCSEAEVASLRDLAVAVWRRVPVAAIALILRDAPLREEPLEHWRRLAGEYERLAAEEAGSSRVELLTNTASPRQALDTLLQKLRGRGNRRRDARGQQRLDYSDPAVKSEELARAPRGFSKLAPAKPSVVFDSYWRFAAERQRIFMARARNELYTTADPILREYKFTNPYRASDRVSQYLIRNVIYKGDSTVREVFFRTLLFKLFNRIETWDALVKKLGVLTAQEFSPRRYSRVLTKLMKDGHRVYSAAYIMPSGGRQSEFARKHEMHLDLLHRMLADALPERLLDCRRLQDAFQLLRGYPTIGDFLAFQYVIDLNYGPDWQHSEMDFVVPGPGALDGIAKCFSDRGGLTEADLIHLVTDRQEREFERLGLSFQSLWGRPLQLIDCQNLFCEISKYARIAHPHVAGVNGRTRIKQRYVHNSLIIDYWYPPKWGLNERIASQRFPKQS